MQLIRRSPLSKLQIYWRLGPVFVSFRPFNFTCVFVRGGGKLYEGPFWEKWRGAATVKQTSLKSLWNFKCWAQTETDVKFQNKLSRFISRLFLPNSTVSLFLSQTLWQCKPVLVPTNLCYAFTCTLNMEAGSSSEIYGDFRRTTRRYIREDRSIHNHRWKPQI
jgi:hypothetical protein